MGSILNFVTFCFVAIAAASLLAAVAPLLGGVLIIWLVVTLLFS